MKYNFKRLLALTLALVMVLAMVPATSASAVTFEKLDSISAELTQSKPIETQNTIPADKMVRAMIVLKGEPAIAQVEDSKAYLGNTAAQDHRASLQSKQEQLADTISKQVLKGKKLDVVWNLTLMANAISANVAYGDLAAIEKLPDVEKVYVETVYYPQTAEKNNIVAQEMTGANVAQNAYGYTGAGTRIAVIDTGTDTDHQSFSAAGFEYALALNAAEQGLSYEEYLSSLDLMDAADIAAVLPQLNATRRYAGLTAEDLYLSTKLPFNFNYVDGDLNVTHDFDDQSSHGSHVAGIAAANRYIPIDKLSDLNGDGAFDTLDAQVLMDHVILGTSAETLFAADLDHNGQLNEADVTLMLDALSGVLCADAAQTVGVTGVAPDAQLITMKVFGVTGGAYTSDYMAATEDAVVLGCDSVNLSLGAGNPGFTFAHDSQGADADYVNGLMASLEEAGVVVAVSAGNSGNWADYDDAYQLMYTDETGTFITSEPATYQNTMGVASADNIGLVTDRKYWFSGANGDLTASIDDASSGFNADWTTLDALSKGTSYEAVFIGDPTALLTDGEQTDLSIYGGSVEDYGDVSGKIVLVARGNLVSFADKHANGALAGAAGVIIYNNVTDPIYASIEGSTATIPCGTISLEAAKAVFELFGGTTGKFNVSYTLNADHGDEGEAIQMSSFSSWGPTGGLTLKPEITAPGGNIYSVNGVDTSGKAYEQMSGTSMSSPHIAGLVALASQFIADKGYAEQTGLSQRVLTQSLMMSTAEPILEKGLPYSVRNQGAGLASIENMILADTYVLVPGQPGGKVKAELGDGTGKRTFTFSLNNLTNESKTYALSAQMMTTGTTVIDGYSLSTDEMVALPADVTFSTGSTVTVLPGSTAFVTVTIEVTAETAASMEALGYTKGFYLEGFVYATAQADAEGTVGASHSIPMLGYYGNWTDPSMFENNDYLDYAYNTLGRPSHMNDSASSMLAWSPVGYGAGLYYSGNIYGSPDGFNDSRYLEERNSINTMGTSQWELFAVYPGLIRNAADYCVTIKDADTGEIYYFNDFEDTEDYLLASFYYVNNAAWYNTTTENPVDLTGWDMTDAAGNPLAEGTSFVIEVGVAPDYYVREDGTVDWSQVGEGAFLRYQFAVDNTVPELLDLKLDGDKLTYQVQDNRYIASVILLTGDAANLVSYSFPDMDADKLGTAISGELDLTGYRENHGNKAAIAVCDYAGNETYYAINLGGEGASYGNLLAFQYDEEGFFGAWSAFSEGVNRNESKLFGSNINIVAAEYVNGLIYAQDDYGNLYGIRYSDMLKNEVDLEATFITKLQNTYQDFAYSYYDGKLYGLLTTEYEGYPTTEIQTINLKGEYYDPDMWMTVAAYQEEWVGNRGGLYGLSMAIDDAGSVYVLGPVTDDETGELTESAHLLKASMEESWGWISLGAFQEVGDTGMGMDYLQSMTWDHNTESLYWAQFNPVGWSTLETALVKLNPETAEPTVVGTLSSETAGLMAPLTAEAQAKAEHANVPNFDASVTAKPTLSSHSLTLGVGGMTTLSLTFDPWYSDDKAMIWSSSNETVVTVDQLGNLKAVGEGKATITVTAKNDETKLDTCEITVASLSVNIEGIVSYTGGGVGMTSGSKLYDFAMEKGVPAFHEGALISAPAEFQGYGLQIGSAVAGRGSLWACEYGNVGMVYEIDPETGVVRDMLQPIDGDMIFGLSYSEKTDLFSGIMNYYFYVDIPMNHEMQQEIMDSYDPERYEFMWHKFDMSEYLAASDKGFNTGEAGNGSIVDIVFSGITDIDNVDGTSYYLYGDFTGGGWYESSYTPDTTHVLLDNVGRLWFIDETTGMTKEETEWGEVFYSNADSSINGDTYGVFAQPMNDGTCNVFIIRELRETAMTDLYNQGSMPRITYHFSDLYYAGTTPEGAPMFFVSMYDYWNEGTTNQLYLYVPGIAYGERYWDMDKNAYVQPMTPDSLYDLGTTGTGNIIASITEAAVIDGLPAIEIPEDDGSGWYSTPLTAGIYRPMK